MDRFNDLKQIWDIYKTGFPLIEQRNFSVYESVIRENPDFKPEILYHDHQPAGLMFHWDTPEFSYLEHFAVKKELRNQGFGGNALDAYVQKFGRVVLEVDPPEDEICRRRIRFYERHGLHFTGISFTHPGYPEERSPYTLYLMTKPAWTSAECDAFLDYLFHHILKAERTD